MTDQETLPIAECFVSPQGEGRYTGTLMLFIRTAGCSVGKPWTTAGLTKELDRNQSNLYVIPDNHEMCSLFDGRTFCCDTNYKVKHNLTLKALRDYIANINVRHVCITGGEPLLHARLLDILIQEIKQDSRICGTTIHLETSGTIPFCGAAMRVLEELKDSANGHHITVSPKLGYIDKVYSNIANEAKLLVDEDFTMEHVPPVLFLKGENELLDVYIQPVNGITEISKVNMARCLELQLKYPWLKLSSQAHKLWGVQ